MRRAPRGLLGRAALYGALVGAGWLVASGYAGAATRTATSAPATAASSWTVYHGDAAGQGVAGTVSAVQTGSRAWTSPALDGEVYGEPLVSGSRVYLATENDTVYALSASTGAVVWSRHLATPVPASSLPCGDISPTVGITGTPVVNPARGEIFVVADELVNGAPAHTLVGLALASGTVEMTQDVDPPGASTAALLQRTGLTLAGGRVVFGMGGNDGDCASYRGRVIAVPEAGGSPAIFTVDGAKGQSQGAIWMGGAAPAVDGQGDVWVSAGNGSVYKASRGYDDSDSVLELSPSMHLLQYFAPSDWPENNSRDLDMSAEPALLADGEVVLAGKAPTAYLLNGAHLGGIAGQQASLTGACAGDIDGGVAVSGDTVFLPCVSGTIAVRVTVSPPALHLVWSSGSGGGPPIVAGGLVWTIGQDGILYGLDPATGKVRQQAAIGGVANHFPTPSVGDGLLLAPATERVVAFRAGPAGSGPAAAAPGVGAGPTASARISEPAAASGSGGGLPAGAIAGIAVAAVVVIGGAGWLVWRRRG